ncbi:MAG: hypothetical protein ABR569_06445 [Gaiellaceae bacterium]
MPLALQNVFAAMTPQARLTALIEEGQRLRAMIPETADDPTKLVQMMLNYDLGYPARVWEWEKRVGTLLNEPQSRSGGRSTRLQTRRTASVSSRRILTSA